MEKVNRNQDALSRVQSRDVNLVSGMCLALDHPGFLSTAKWPGNRFRYLQERGQRVIFAYHGVSWLKIKSDVPITKVF